MGGGSPEKEPREEYHVLNEKGEEVEVMQLPANVGDEFYVEVLSDNEQKILPYKKLVKTEEGWGEEVEPGKIKQIKEQNIKVGKVDRKNKTISFE